LLGPNAIELILLDPQKNFSSTFGWALVLDRLFPRGLMLRDFDEHRLHRRALSVAFKAGPMKSYLEELNAGIVAQIAKWPRGREMQFYPAIKQLTLDLAATSFLGGQIGPEMQAVNRAFIDMIAATVAPMRTPLPGTKMRRGVNGRAFMSITSHAGSQLPAHKAAMICFRSFAELVTKTGRCFPFRISSIT
jgi:cytochrome P450